MPISWGGGSWGSGTWGIGEGSPPSPTSAGANTTTGNAVTLALDHVTWDLALPVRFIRGPAAIMQKILCRLKFFLAEYYLDQRLGVPWHQSVFPKGASLTLINALFSKVISSVPGVTAVTSMFCRLDNASRELEMNWTATLDDNTVLVVAEEPFIVTGNAGGKSY